MTMSNDSPGESVAISRGAVRGSWFSDRTKLLLAISLVLMVLGSLLARFVQTDFGRTMVSETTGTRSAPSCTRRTECRHRTRRRVLRCGTG
jgi:hypothetical protein